MAIFRVKPQPCPHCGGNLDAAADLTMNAPERAEAPQPDEVGLCWHCCKAVTYGAGGVLRRTTPADIGRLSLEGRMDLLLAQVSMIARRREAREAAIRRAQNN